MELKLPGTVRSSFSLAPTVPDDECPGNEFILSADVELFASPANRNENLFCCKAKSAWKYDWGRLGLTCANPPFTTLIKELCKFVLDQADTVLLTPDWK